MEQTRYRLIFTALAAVALLLASCSKEPAAEQIPSATRLSLSVDGVKAIGSAQRGTRAASEGAVNDLWVLQFNTSGSQLTRQYIASVSNATSIELPTALSVAANSTLYLVANTGNASLFSSQTLTQAKAITVALTTTTGGGIPSDGSTVLPMVGQSAALTFSVSTAIPVNLTRTVAKITLTVKNPLATGYPQLTVQSVQLKNVPTTYSTQVVNSANGFTGTTYYPAASAANFTAYTATTGNITAAGTTSTYYLAPNVRGIGTNTDDRLKSDLTAASGQGSSCTYVEILGTAKASATAPVVDVRYRLYLGANNTNNFNIESNTAYKVGIELTGINGNDARMTIATDKFDLIQGGTDGDNSEDIGGFVLPTVGDYYYSDGSFSTDLTAGKKATGMIYYIDPADSKKYKVMSLDEAATTPAWAATSDYVVSGARSDADGKANSKAIRDYFEANTASVGSNFAVAFPAAAYCYNYKGRAGADALGSWHLPAKSELQYLWCAYNGVAPISWTTGTNDSAPADAAKQKLWNDRIKAGGGAKDITSNSFWSSTEEPADFAWSVNFSTGGTYAYLKSITAYVRCVRDIAPPPPPSPVNPPSASDYVTIGSLRWTKGNLVAKNTNECKVGAPADYGVYFRFGSLVGWTGGASGDGTGQGSPATVDKAVWPLQMGAAKPSFAWQNNSAASISTLANYYFNYSAAPWQTRDQNIRDFNVPIAGDSGSGTLADGRYAQLGVGDPCTYYLGAPWRTPTTTELASITGKTGVWATAGLTGRWVTSSNTFDGVSGPGGWFGAPLSAGTGTPSTANNAFFPASGYRYNSSGSFYNVTTAGYGWSSSVGNATDGLHLYFYGNGVVPQSNYNRSSGFPVRCVSSVP